MNYRGRNPAGCIGGDITLVKFPLNLNKNESSRLTAQTGCRIFIDTFQDGFPWLKGGKINPLFPPVFTQSL